MEVNGRSEFCQGGGHAGVVDMAVGWGQRPDIIPGAAYLVQRLVELVDVGRVGGGDDVGF